MSRPTALMERIHSFMTKLFCSKCCHFLSRLANYQEKKVRIIDSKLFIFNFWSM